jgi:hypothetical protein
VFFVRSFLTVEEGGEAKRGTWGSKLCLSVSL